MANSLRGNLVKLNQRKPIYSSLATFISILLQSCGSNSETANLDESVEQRPSANPYVKDRNNSEHITQLINSDISESVKNLALIDAADPYWVKALEMEQFHALKGELPENKVFHFGFPTEMPTYFDALKDKRGWQPVTETVEIATREILNNFSQILDIDFIETDNFTQPFVIAVMSNEQSNTDAYAYFPSPKFSIGSDLFLDRQNLAPSKLTHSKTNYEYEAIVHELGHTLGLKHPFASLGSNQYVLPNFEDTSKLTSMTYTENANYFLGDLKIFDYLTLVQVYGVNPEFNGGNDIYTFSSAQGVFLIDGGGIDLIDANNEVEDVVIDLRENGHSYSGGAREYISLANQLTISIDSEIENATSGSGADIVVGNALDNVLRTGAGDDQIFSGEGRDIIFPGSGNNVINLFEYSPANDFVVFDRDASNQFNEIYNFEVGGTCDTLVFEGHFNQNVKLSPIVAASNIAQVQNYDIIRVLNFNSDAVALNFDNLYTDKIIISNLVSDSILETQIFFYDADLNDTSALFSIAQIFTNEARLENWTLENLMIL